MLVLLFALLAACARTSSVADGSRCRTSPTASLFMERTLLDHGVAVHVTSESGWWSRKPKEFHDSTYLKSMNYKYLKFSYKESRETVMRQS
jgi:hypothetical protein